MPRHPEADTARTRTIMTRLTEAELDDVDAALQPGETRAEFMRDAARAAAAERLKHACRACAGTGRAPKK